MAVSLTDVDGEELKTRIRELLSQMDSLGGELGPLLARYGHLRQEAADVVEELNRRGITSDGEHGDVW